MKWRPVDIVVLVLAVALGAAILVTVVAPLLLGEPLSDVRSKILSTIATATVSVISVYVGACIRTSGKETE